MRMSKPAVVAAALLARHIQPQRKLVGLRCD